MNPFSNRRCGCGDSEPSEEEIERIIREAEEDDERIHFIKAGHRMGKRRENLFR